MVLLLTAETPGLRSALAGRGYEVDTVESGDAVVDRAAESDVDCVVASLELPDDADRTGFDLAGEIGERDPLLPVVIVGDAPLSEVAERALAADAAAYVSRREGAFEAAVADAVDDAVATYRRHRDRARLPRDGPDPGFVLRDGAIRCATPGVADLLGDDDVTERSLADLAAETDREVVRAAIRDADGDGRAVRFAPATESERTVEARFRRTADGAVVGTLLDVTEQEQRLTDLERQVQRLDEFAEVLTHDLRNPLNVAIGYLGVAREDPHEEAFEKCDDALTRIETLIDEVRSSVLEDQTEPDPEPVSLDTVAREAWSTVDTGGATLEIDGAMRLRADRQRLRQLFENLFRNSVEHGSQSAEGGAGLTVRVVALDDGFAVEDDGVGLPEDVDDGVFERGFTTTRTGTGFGLAIVRNVAETHGWEIATGESEAGGARFAFSQVLRSGESVVEMTASGDDIWDASDQGHFYYAEQSGDFDASVEVLSVEHTHAWAKGGLMVRASADPEAAHVMVRRRPNGSATVQWRPEAGSEARSLTSLAGRPHTERDETEPLHDWLRLVRDGDEIRAYTSETGDDGDWALLTELTASEVQLPEDVLLGVAGTSKNRAESTTVRFANLAGVDPSVSEDLGDPIIGGQVTATQPVLVAAHEAADVTATTATLRGSVESMQASDELDVHFEHREVMADEWTETEAERLTDPGTIRATVSGLSPRRYYEYRVVADYGDGDVESSTTALVGTRSRSPGVDRPGPRTSAQHDPRDGFADVAPWLDDDTPVIRITEPDREQLETAASVDGPRVITFETSGTIDLEGRDVTVTGDECWIAGQTAPSPGITLIRGRFEVSADDCVVQHVRSRPGDAGRTEDFEWEGILVDGETENVVVDHCTVTWSPVENVAIGYRTTDVTMSNCLVTEALYDTICAPGRRGFGTLVGDDAASVALLGNVWAHNRGRNPWLQLGSETAVVNNVHYDFDEAVVLDGSTEAVIEGNAFLRGDPDFAAISGGRAYLADNRTDADTPAVEDVERLSERPVWSTGIDPLPGDAALEHALDHAGARPADRTAHDERVVEQLRNGTGDWIDSQDDVGGYPQLAENSESVDVPDRGLRAWLREQARAVEP